MEEMNFDDIVAKVKECGKKTVAVSVAQDSAVLEAVHEAKRLGIADAILVGDEAKIREIAAGLNMDLKHTYMRQGSTGTKTYFFVQYTL